MWSRKNQELPEWDDCETIAKMNVPGMPWYTEQSESAPDSGGEKLSSREMRLYTWGAVKAALLVVGIFFLGLVLFIAFCVFVWFR